MNASLTAVNALARREILLFLRDRARLLGTIVQVVGIWAVLGLGFGNSFSHVDVSGKSVAYTDYLFPGMILLVVLFASIFSTISIVEDRQHGFLHAALVSPLSRGTLALGTVAGSAAMAFFQAGLLLFATPFVEQGTSEAGILITLFVLLVISFGFTSLGALFAWRIRTTRGFHAVMNLVLMPLWILSGALFPAAGAHPVVQWMIRLNPVSYALEAIRIGLSERPAGLFVDELFPLMITVLVSAALFAAVTLGMPRSLRTD